jgi:import inner membrane translocase subunit TIM8
MEQNIDLTKLSDKDKQELNQVLTNEAQKSNIQQSEFST